MGLSSKQVSSDGFDWATNLTQAGALGVSKMARGRQQQSGPPLKCPRCDSTNTKFCYYNNYNQTQPRHFCKACRRHWTKGGTLRNVPVGGGRKNKRPSTSNSINNNNHTSASQHQQPTSYLFPSLQQGYHNNGSLGSTIPRESIISVPNIPTDTLMASSNNPSSYSRSQHPNVLNYRGETTPTEIFIPSTATTTTPVLMQGQLMDSSSLWNWEDLSIFVSTDSKEACANSLSF
ncbi:hypothetical protein ACHQM5_017413 [Ranunculus cassubicifolius]